jgi:uncharacterized membrane protein
MFLRTRIRFFLQSLSKPEIFTVLVLLIFGSATAFMTPVSAGYDEETHLARVWEMSAGQLIPNEVLGSELPFPAVYYELSYRRMRLVKAVPPEFMTPAADLRLDEHDYIYGAIETRSVYSPPLLAPQAFVMRYLGRALGLPALTVFYVCRLAGLLGYMLLAWLAYAGFLSEMADRSSGCRADGSVPGGHHQHRRDLERPGPVLHRGSLAISTAERID